jgi:hypothetical protein
MSFLPPLIPSLDEVKPENLVRNEEYLIDFTSYDNQNVKEKGKFVELESDSKFAKFKVPTMGNITVPFLNTRTRYYRPKTQKILDNLAQRQYVAQETARLINENTDTELGDAIVEDFNKPKPPSGGKRVKKNKNTKRKRKQIRHKKRKSRTMK